MWKTSTEFWSKFVQDIIYLILTDQPNFVVYDENIWARFLFGHSVFGCVDADYEHERQTDRQTDRSAAASTALACMQCVALQKPLASKLLKVVCTLFDDLSNSIK